MTSVERINQYGALEQEPPAYTDIRPPKHWPHCGRIQVENMSLTYRGLAEPSLGPVSFTIQPYHKVGPSLYRKGHYVMYLELSFGKW